MTEDWRSYIDPDGLWDDSFVPQLAVLQEADPFVLLCPVGHSDVLQGDRYLRQDCCLEDMALVGKD